MRQFLDIGSGLPTSPVLAEGAAPLWLATHGAARDVVRDAILSHESIRRAGFSLDDPACVILCCVPHFLDAGTARRVVDGFSRSLAPGSYMIISVGVREGRGPARSSPAPSTPRTVPDLRPLLEDISALFDGLEVVPPGIADCATWRTDSPPAAPADQDSMILGAVARRP